MAILETALRDAGYALRVLRRTPLFTTAAVLTLGVAIGVNTAVFSIVDAVLLQPLPYPDAHRLALVSRVVTADGVPYAGTSVDGRTWEAVRDGAASVRSAVYSTWTTGVNLNAPGSSAPGHARHVQQQRVGSGFFETLGARPAIGRDFSSEEDTVGGSAATILSAELWRSFFKADPAIVGRTVMLKGAPYTVVGVMPDGFRTGSSAALWTPLRPSTTGEGAGENYQVLLRLRADADWSQTTAELTRIGADLNRAHPPEIENAVVSFSFVPLRDGMTAGLRQPLLLLWGAVGVVLIVACVNLAGLLLARGSQRSREIATRMALGSGRAGVIRQLLVESVVLALTGGALGLALGTFALDLLTWLARDAYEIWQPVALDGRGIAAALVLSVLASVVFGLFPALQASRLDVQTGLMHGSARGVAGSANRWPRRLIIVSQVALGVILLISAGLLLRTFTHLRGLDPGFDPDNLVTASVSLEDDRYRTSERVTQLFERTLARLDRSPGIQSSAVALELPYTRLLNLGFRHLDGPQAAAGRTATTSATYVSPAFFDAMRIPVRAGRTFTESDRQKAPPVVIVSDAFVRMYFEGESPLGRRISVAGAEREIVGQVGDVQVRPGWGNNGPIAAMPLAYVPVTQVTDGFLRLVHGWFSPTFIVRSATGTADAAAAMRRALDDVDPLLPFASVRPMSRVRDASLATPRFLMALLVGLAGVAVALAAIGIHGLIATSVAERTREMGIRLALGATMGHAVRSVAVPGLLLAGAGVAAGLIASMGIVNTLRAFVWGVSPTDPLTFAAVAALFLTVAAIASLLPALRILRLDPAATLRQD